MSTTVVGMIVALALIAIIWFVFVAPAERRYHDRKLRLMQERIERHRQHVEEGDAERRDDARKD